MKEEQKSQFEKNRKLTGLQIMYFNRYLLVRYVTALFFFSNFYWMISLLFYRKNIFVVLPLILMIMMGVSIAEQIKIFHNHSNNVPYTKWCYILMIIAEIFLILTSSSSRAFSLLYPFMKDGMRSRSIIITILFNSILLCTFILHRLQLIRNNEDKQYQRIKEYEKSIKI